MQSKKQKKRKNGVVSWFPYGRLLTAIKIRAPTMAIAKIIAAVAAAMYISVGGKLATGIGETVGATSAILKAVSAYELK